VGDAAIVCGVAALVFDSQWPRKAADPQPSLDPNRRPL
jgi:hypothetical protein